MKVVIDIDEERYENLKLCCASGLPIKPNEKLIANGTPLEKVFEDIKTEMQNEMDKFHNDGTYSYNTSRIGLRKALNIIDKHLGKEK